MFFLSLFLSFNLYLKGQDYNSIIKADSDSLILLLEDCETDTCRFRILYNYYWKYADKNHDRVKEIGEKAYSIIKYSDNIRLLTDGYDIKGGILEKQKQFDSAYIYFRRALNLSLKIKYRSRSQWSMYHLGLNLRNMGYADSSLYYFKELQKQGSFNIESPSAPDVLKQIAFLFFEDYHLQDSAELYLNKILELSMGDPEKESEAYLTLMSFYYKTNQIRRLFETIDAALVHAEEENYDKVIINIYDLIGDMFLVQKKNYETALLYYKKVLEICRSKYTDWEATILNDIGDLYLQMGNDSMAYVSVKEGFEVAKSINYKHQLSESYRNLGKIYRYRGDIARAIENFQLCYDTGCDICSKVVFHKALIDIGDSYVLLNNREKASEYYYESLALAQHFNAKKEEAISDLRLGNYYSLNNKEKARLFYESSAEKAKESDDLGIIKDIADTLSRFYLSSLDYKKAFEYLNLSSITNDSIIEREKEANLSEWELKFEIDKINKDNLLNEQLAEAEIKRQKTYRNFSLLIAILFIILGSVVYRSFRRKKKDNLLLEKMTVDLNEANEMKLRFFANVSHELRTPLTLIKAPLDILLKQPDNHQQKDYLELINKSSRKLTNLINQLLYLRKVDEGAVTLQPVRGNISACINDIVSLFKQVAENNSVELSFRSSNDIIIPFDPEKIETIITNLLTNAFKHTHEDGKVIVSIEKESADTIKIIVQDTGKGIKNADIDRIFNRFYSVQEDLGNNSGIGSSGIGLSLVKELVTIHKGNISVESKEGSGTKFTITIPAGKNPYPGITVVLPDKEPEEIESGKLLSCNVTMPQNFELDPDYKVLLVEDNSDLRNFLKSEISKYTKVIIAGNGDEGFKLAEAELPDIIITDVMMPVMDGIELCKLLKSNLNTSHIPVIILSAKASLDSQIKGINTGADDYIPKPFDLSLLLAKIHSVLKSREALRRHYRTQLSIIPSEITVTNADEGFLKKLIDIVEERIAEDDLSANLIAALMGMSRSVLYAKLKEITGQSVNEFTRSVKLKKASMALLQNNKSISEIAYMHGFNTPQYFTKCFKEEFGTSPKEYASRFNQ
ncbi:MAG TPA: ATP-binding protein [Bacteroidales bacterium]|nr:ATP-binding protein [Bacteroidales bacterium]